MDELLLTKNEILDELRNLCFEVKGDEGIYRCMIVQNINILGLYSKSVTVTIHEQLNQIKFSSTSFSHIGFRPSNSATKDLDFMTKNLLHHSLLDVCTEIKEMIRDNKLDSLLHD